MPTVNAQVRYLNPEWKGRDDIPSIGDRESRRANTSKWEVAIHDARGLELDLDRDGFLLCDHTSAVTDFHDDGEVVATYYPEVTALLTRLTGADAVCIIQHLVRTEDTSDFNKAYARFVHCDYSPTDLRRSAAANLERSGLDPALAESWDFAWYNSWQPIEREVQQNPLAMINSQTLAQGDVVDYWFTGYRSKVRTSMPVYNPDHRFYYFPRMQPSELLVIKQLDSRGGRAVSCPHTSFDLEQPEGPLGRRSIEVRMMCGFAPSG